MKVFPFLLLPTVALALLSSCERKEEPVPDTPEAMYERVRELLRPGVEDPEQRAKEALTWLHRAGEAGYLQAQTDLGGLYLEGGKGVKKDEAEAYRWFARAAEQGSPEAHLYLAELLLRGGAVPRDEAAALMHGRQAAEAGLTEGMLMVGLDLIRSEEGIEEGMEWLRKAAESQSLRTAGIAAGMLGDIYAKGARHVEPDAAQAVQWYRRGAQVGYARAQMIYALILLEGEAGVKDEEQGMAYLRMAAGQDYPRAIAALINRLRNAGGDASLEKEADAWSRRLEELLRRTAPAAPGRGGDEASLAPGEQPD